MKKSIGRNYTVIIIIIRSIVAVDLVLFVISVALGCFFGEVLRR